MNKHHQMPQQSGLAGLIDFPFHFALASGNMRVAREMFKQGMDLTVADKNNKFPVDYFPARFRNDPLYSPFYRKMLKRTYSDLKAMHRPDLLKPFVLRHNLMLGPRKASFQPRVQPHLSLRLARASHPATHIGVMIGGKRER